MRITDNKYNLNGLAFYDTHLTRSLLDAYQESAILIDTSGIVLELNNAALDYLDKHREDIIGSDFFDCIDSAIGKERKQYIDSVVRTRSTVEFQDKIKGRWYSNMISPVLKNGYIKWIALFSRDITEEKNIAKELDDSKEKLSSLFENAPDAYYLMDEDGVFTDVNVATEKLFGFSREELIGKNFFDFDFILDRQKIILEEIVNCISGKRPSGPNELISFNKSRGKIAIENRTIPIKINGQSRVLGIARDLNVTKDLEDNRIENELNYFQIFEYALESIMLIDVKTLEIIRVNKSAATGLGYSKSELVGKRLLEIVPEEAFTDIYKNIETVNRNGHGLVRSKRIKKDGTVIPVEISVKVTSFFGKNVYQNFVRDISKSVSKEELLLNTNLDLKHKFEETSLELESKKEEFVDTLEKLTQTQFKLINSEKMSSLGHLSAGIAHEINNPMNYIRQNVYSINKGLEDYKKIFEGLDKVISTLDKDHVVAKEYNSLKEQVEFEYLQKELYNSIEDIKEGVTQTLSVTHELKQFSRKDEDIDNGNENISNVINSTIKLMRSEFEFNKITINKSYSNVFKLYCNANKLNQVFVNIFSNAIHAIQKSKNELGQGLILIKTAITENEELLIQVIDNGIGMPQKVAEKIFDPFYTTKNIEEGTGLGLSIANSIVRENGGRILVSSKKKVGTTFNIYLPILRVKVM